MKYSTWQFLVRYSLGKPGALSAYRESIKNQFITKVELDQISWHKTKILLEEAYKNVPWYQQSFNRIGLHPEDIQLPEHFSQIPILTRNEVIENFELFISKKADPKKLKYSTTGGSTGTPLKIGMQANGVREVPKWQMLSWWGLSPTENMATIYRGLPVSGLKGLALNMINWPQQVIRMDATKMTSDKIEEFVSQTIRLKPRLIHGYVGAVDAIADFILENNIQIPSPKVVWLTAAPVNPIQERKISQAFKAPVCDQYGCSELYFISAECPHKQGLHIFADAVKLEILDQENQNVPSGTYGRIVITNLDEFHFPLIRYQNGDSGRFIDKTCSCGMSLPLMDKVKGRVSDNVILPNGVVLAGEYLTTIFDDYTDSVKQFQIAQHKDQSISVRIVLKELQKEDQIRSWVLKELTSKIENQVELKVIFTDKIVSEKGKLQFIVRE